MIFAADLGEPEAPVLLPDDSWLVTEMAPGRGTVTHISQDGQSRQVLARTGRPNGLASDRQGFIWVAETLTPTLLRLTPDGRSEVFLEECDGEPFLFPNDLCFGPDGALYLTDSGIHYQELAPNGQIRPDYDRLSYDGRAYRIDIWTRQIRKLDAGLRFANGIAFGPDNALYVSETLTGLIHRYLPRGDGAFGPRQAFANVLDPQVPAYFKGPDGIKFGADGNLYVTVYGQSDVTVLAPDGTVVERIETGGRKPTNLAFGPRGQQRIYVTEVEHGRLESFIAGTDGLPLFSG